MIYVGGDTGKLEFDFGTKMARSVSECPLKIFYSYMPSLQDPSSSNWIEYISQNDIDKLKTLDNNVLTLSNSTNTNISAIMIEVDLTPFCNKFFGGSNSALKNAIKSINVDVWASGSGAEHGVKKNGCAMQFWLHFYNVWSWSKFNGNNNWGDINTQSTIQKLINVMPSRDIDKRTIINNIIDTSNKIYILIHSKYPSDSKIPSIVNLDFFHMDIEYSRSPDIVAPITVTL